MHGELLQRHFDRERHDHEAGRQEQHQLVGNAHGQQIGRCREGHGQRKV